MDMRVGRPPALTSTIGADACVALAKNDAMEAAARLCEAPLIGEDDDDDALLRLPRARRRLAL